MQIFAAKMKDAHTYSLNLEWPSRPGDCTDGYKTYSRNHFVSIPGKFQGIELSSDPAFRGDISRFNPEELLLASLSSCHMLWYLHLCAVNGVVVKKYKDNATGTMTMDAAGSGKFTEVMLHPEVIVEGEEMIDRASTLHAEATEKCFIANSVNFEVKHAPRTLLID